MAIPPWIVTPDAAGRYVQGYGLGLDVASRRAAQAVQQQQMALRQQSMEQARQTAAENAARQAIALQLEENFRKAQLAADANKLAQAKTLADAARDQAETLAQNQITSREKIAGQENTLRELEIEKRYAPKPVATPTGESMEAPGGNIVNVGDRWQYVADPRLNPLHALLAGRLGLPIGDVGKTNETTNMPEYYFDAKTGQVVKRK